MDLQTAILEVWQTKELAVDSADLWQTQDLAVSFKKAEVCDEGMRKTAWRGDIYSRASKQNHAQYTRQYITELRFVKP